MNPTAPQNYSSRVSLTLHALGQAFPLAKIGPGYVVPSSPINLPPCPAQVVMTVDGRPRTWTGTLVNGAVPFDEEIRFEDTITNATPGIAQTTARLNDH